MTREELQDKIDELEEAAGSLDEPEKTFKLGEIDRLKIKIEGMALEDVLKELEKMELPAHTVIDEQIKKAKDAQEANETRVEAFNIAFSIIKTALKIII